MKKEIAGMSLLVVLLAGCATTKPEMTEENYWNFGREISFVEKCVEAKYFSVETNAAAIRVLGTNLNSWSYDKDKLKESIKTAYVIANEVDCNKMAASIIATQQKWDRQASQAASQPTPVYIPQTRNIFCNRVGSQLLCNSF